MAVSPPISIVPHSSGPARSLHAGSADWAIYAYDYCPEGVAGPLRRERCGHRSRLVDDHHICPAGTATANRWIHIGAIPNIDGPGPHGGEVHPDGDEFLYVVTGTMELILDD